MHVLVSLDDLANSRAENERLTKQNTELQNAMNKLVAERRQSLRAQVREFHAVMGQPIGDVPRAPSPERVRLRLRLIAEEFFELLDACLEDVSVNGDMHRHIDAAIDESAVNVDMVAVADAAGDTQYVLEGLMIEFGIDSGPVLAEIQKSNLTKTGGGQRADGKIVKGPMFRKPDLHGVLVAQGLDQ